MRLNISSRSATMTAAIALLFSVAAADLAYSQSSGGTGGQGAGGSGQSGTTGAQGQGTGGAGATGGSSTTPQMQTPQAPGTPSAPSATTPGTPSQTGTPSSRPSAAGAPSTTGTPSTTTSKADMNSIPLTTAASDLKGKNVYDASGKKIGEVKDAVIESGQVKSVVIEYGGFLGIGEKAAAVPVDKLQMSGDRIVGTSLTKESLEAMPEFKK